MYAMQGARPLKRVPGYPDDSDQRRYAINVIVRTLLILIH